MRVLIKSPGSDYRQIVVPNQLEVLQQLVDGYIETVTIHGATKDIVVICDEEGRLKGKEPNCTIAGVSFVGSIVVCGVDGEDFTDCPYRLEFMRKITQEALYEHI